MSGKKSRSKGLRHEQALVNACREVGLEAERVPLSGAAGGSYTGDVMVRGRRFEAKIRANGFRELYKWIEGNYGVFLRSNRHKSLVVLRFNDFQRLFLGTDNELLTKEERN